MILGSAGIFGGNERARVVSLAKPIAVKQTQEKAAVSEFAPLLKVAAQSTSGAILKPTVAAKVLAGARNVAVKSSSPAVAPAVRTGVIRPATALNLVNGLPPLSVATTAETTGTTKASVIDTLKASLVQAGVDINGMQFTEHRDFVTYPTGSYINDMISLSTSGGRSHEYMTDLVAIAPQVTVNEIQQLLLGNRG